MDIFEWVLCTINCQFMFLLVLREQIMIKILSIRVKDDLNTNDIPDWEEIDDDDAMNMMKDKSNTKLKIMNVATAMATLGMANTRGLEDPSVGPMLLSHA